MIDIRCDGDTGEVSKVIGTVITLVRSLNLVPLRQNPNTCEDTEFNLLRQIIPFGPSSFGDGLPQPRITSPPEPYCVQDYVPH